MRTLLTYFLLAGLVVLALNESAEARSKRINQIPNGGNFRCGTCHINPDSGGERNDFGQMVEAQFLTAAGFSGDVEWGPELAELDADGDGFSNGEELGDPDGVWSPGQRSPLPSESHPGDGNSFPQATSNPDAGIGTDSKPFPQDTFFDELRGTVVSYDFPQGIIQLSFHPIRLDDQTVYRDGETGELLALDDFFIDEHLTVQTQWFSDGTSLAVIVERNGNPPPEVQSQWISFGGVEILSDGALGLSNLGESILIALDAPVFFGEDGQEIGQIDVQEGDFVALQVRNDKFGTAVLEIHVDPPPFSPEVKPGEEPFEPEPSWSMFQEIFDVDVVTRNIRFMQDPMRFDQGTFFADALGNRISSQDLVFGDELVIEIDWREKRATRVELKDPERFYDFPFDNPDIGYLFTSFERIDGELIRIFDQFTRPVALDAFMIDEATGAELTLADLAALDRPFIRALIRRPQAGEQIPDIITEIALNAEDAPQDLEPGDLPQPTEIFGVWEDYAIIGAIDLERRELLRLGVDLQLVSETDIFDRDGRRVGIEALQPGLPIVVDIMATRDPGLVVAREIRIEPPFPKEGFALPLYGTNVAFVDGDHVTTNAGIWQLSSEVQVFDGQSGLQLAEEDVQPGDFTRIFVQHTDVGDFIERIEIDPQLDGPVGDFWQEDFEIFSFDGDTGELFFAGFPVELSSRTKVFDHQGFAINIRDISVGKPIVVTFSPSLSGGPPVARTVEVQNFAKPYDGINLIFTTFAGLDGDLILTVEHPRFVAFDADIAGGTLDDLLPGTPVRATILHSLTGQPNPFGDIVAELEINPQHDEGGIVETGDIHGFVIAIDPASRQIELDGPVLNIDKRTEVIDVDLKPLSIVDLSNFVGEFAAVNFFQDFNGLKATKIALLSPTRLPEPRTDLIVAPLSEIIVAEGVLRLQGPVVTVRDNAEIRDPDGSLIGLADIELGEEVRLQVERGPSGSVAARIKLVGAFDGPIFAGGGLQVVSTFPQPGESFVAMALDIEVVFNQQVRDLLDDPDFDIGTYPPTEFTLELSRDLDAFILAGVQLQEDTAYQLFVQSERFGLFTSHFTTGDALPEGAILGRLDLPSEIPRELIAREESGVFLLDAEILAPVLHDLTELSEAESDKLFDSALVAATTFDDSGTYRFDILPDGEYFVFSLVVVEFGFADQVELDAFYDGDADGEEDIVVVAGGLVDRVDLSVVPPDPLAIELMTPADGATTIAAAAEAVVRFSAPLRLDPAGYPMVDLVIFPEPLSGPVEPQDLVLGGDRMQVAVAVSLADSTTYTLLVRAAESVNGLELEDPQVHVFRTGGTLPTGTFAGRLALPDLLPAERVIGAPALVALVRAVDFNGLDPELISKVQAGALSEDGSFSFAHVEPDSYVVIANVGVGLPPFFRLSNEFAADFAAFDALNRFGAVVPDDFVFGPFFGFSRDAAGDPVGIRPDGTGIDIVLRPEDLRKTALRVESVEPAKEALLAASEVFDLVLNFSEPLVTSGDFVELDAVVDPPLLSGDIFADFTVIDGGRQVVFHDVRPDPGISHRLTVFFARGISGEELAEPISLAIRSGGTGDLVLGAVRGTVTLVDDEISEAAVFLYDPEEQNLAAAAGVLLAADGTFLIADVIGGEYAAYATIATVGGEDLLLFFDVAGDGAPDVFTVGADTTSGIDFSARALGALAGVAGPNAIAEVALDLNGASGDQRLGSSEVAGGEIVELAVYGSGLENATGVSMGVSFDTSQVSFVAALYSGAEEANVLKSRAGAVVIFLPARTRPSPSGKTGSSQVETAGAILSPTSATAADGAGLLGIFRFQTLADYKGTTLQLDQVAFNSLGGVQDTLHPQLNAVLTPPLDLLAQEKGLFSFDFDPGSAEQFHQGQVAVGEEVTVQIHINEVESLVNYSFKMRYDPEQLSYVAFSGENFLAQGGGIAIELDPLVNEGANESTVDIGGAILGGTDAVAVSGSHLVGTLTLVATQNFSETDLVIVEASSKAAGAAQQAVELSVFARISAGRLNLTGTKPSAVDFDGDGEVGFGDFFLFGDAFTATVVDSTFDIDGDGEVGTGDFFIFADLFGQSAGKRISLPDTASLSGALLLDAESRGQVVIVDLSSRDLLLRGYAAAIEYDPRAFRLLEVSDRNSVMRHDGTALLLNENNNARVLVGGSRVGGAHAVSGLLAQLRFAPLYPEAEGVFRISEAQVRGANGHLGQVLKLGQVAARLAPEAFALQANYPNPFNPTTTIRYQVAVGAPVRLEIFDVLGQRVRTLIAETQAAGFHRVVWDSRDDGGRAVAAGVYLYRLQAGNLADRAYRGDAVSFSQVRKLLLLK